MNTDITPRLFDAVSSRAAWSPGHAGSLADSLAQAVTGAWVDWDEDSGEEWARVVVDQFVVALIRARTPLVLVVRGEASHLRRLGSEAVSVIVDDLETPWLTATEESIRQAFPEREVSPTLDPTAFSAMDLWFATT